MRPLRLFAFAAPSVLATLLAPACVSSDPSPSPGSFDAASPGFDAPSSSPDVATPDVASPTPDAAPSDASADAAVDTGTLDAGADGAAGNGPYLYFADNAGNALNGFALASATGALTGIDMVPGTAGFQAMSTATQPLAVAAHPSGRYVFTAHTNGNIGTYAISAANGTLVRVDTDAATGGIQDFNVGGGAALEGIAADPLGRVLYAADTNNNKLITLSVEATTGALAVLQRTTVAATNPRGVVVDPLAKFVFVVGNLTPATLTRVALDNGGLPTATADVALPNSGNCASGALSPAGRLYAACSQDQKVYAATYNAGANTLVASVGAAAGVSPIGVAVHPNGNFAYAASFSAMTITTFALAADGAPTVLGTPLAIGQSCRTLGFDATGAHLFAGCNTKMLTFDVNATTGALTASSNVAGVGDSTYSLAIVNP